MCTLCADLLFQFLTPLACVDIHEHGATGISDISNKGSLAAIQHTSSQPLVSQRDGETDRRREGGREGDYRNHTLSYISTCNNYHVGH